MNAFNFIGYLIFAFVTSITPGPNNFLLFTLGKNYGLRSSLGFMAGIFLGFTTLLYCAGYGIANIISVNNVLALSFKIICSIWLLYLAIHLRKPDSEIKIFAIKKHGIIQGFMLQFINPKAWVMAIGGSGSFLPKLNNVHLSVFVFAFSFALIGIPCMVAWVSMGDVISRIIKSEKANQIIGSAFFLLMLTSILLIWLD